MLKISKGVKRLNWKWAEHIVRQKDDRWTREITAQYQRNAEKEREEDK